MTFGARLRRARKRKGLTQAELANQAGLGLRTIISYEKGETYPQKRSAYAMLAKLLDTDGGYLESGLPQQMTQAILKLLELQQLYKQRYIESDGEDRTACTEYFHTTELLEEELAKPFSSQVSAAKKESKSDAPKVQFTIRPAHHADLPQLLEIYAKARKAMAANGNPRQWGKTNPGLALLVQDIDKRQLYVVEADGKPCASFVLAFGTEPTYKYIEHGTWFSDAPYATIHRLASDGSQHGIFAKVMQFCIVCCPHLRADTHADNKVMQRLLHKEGFERTGTIYVANGSPRLAYERLPKQ